MTRPNVDPRPPRGYRWLIRWCAHPKDRDCLLTDLDDEFEAHWHRRGPQSARQWYRTQVRHSLIPILARRLFPWWRTAPFGNGPREEPRTVQPVRQVLDGVVQDLRAAIRALERRKGFAAFAVLTTGLAVGAATAVYSTVDWFLNRPPGGVREPDHLVTLRTTAGQIRVTFSFREYERIRRFQDSFVDLAAYAKTPGVLSTGDRSDQVVFEFVSGNYFELLGLRPAVGRVITPLDDVPGGIPGVMLSDATWRSRFGGDPKVIDREITLNGHPARILGVVPSEFVGYALDWNGPTSIWLPVQSYAAMYQSNILERIGQNGIFFPLIGRLRSDESFELAEQKAQAWVSHLEVGANDSYKRTAIVIQRSNEARISNRNLAWEFFRVLVGVCTLVLLSACFNVANFLIGHIASRRREIALRYVLGASRLRVARQLLFEAGLIGVAAGGVGALVAVLLVRGAADLPRIFLRIPVMSDAVIDSRLFAIALAAGLGAAITFGVVPALMACLRSPVADLRNARPHWSWGRFKLTARQALLVLQVSLAVVLTATAGLYANSLWKIAAIDPGYPVPERVLLARVVPHGMSVDESTALWRTLLPTLRELPGVVSASVMIQPPYMPGRNAVSLPERAQDVFETGDSTAGPGFFATAGQRLTAGREFDGSPEDLQSGLIVNQVLAERLWPGESAIGKAVILSYTKQRRTVIGVVANGRCQDLLSPPAPCVYRPFPMRSSGYLFIRSEQPPLTLVPRVRQLIYELAPHVAVAEETALDAHLRRLTAAERMSAGVTMGLALLAIVLLGTGCLSLFVSMVNDSRRELAIRIALGATHVYIWRRIVAQGMVLTFVGIATGLGLSRFVGARIADQLYQVTPSDPLVLLSVSGLIGLIGLATIHWASVLAMRTSPSRLLRLD
jgi:predicted permease